MTSAQEGLLIFGDILSLLKLLLNRCWSSLAASIGSGSTSAEAGPVRKMASGGMLRDRVPALLEPGEFVKRRPAAKAAGGPALNALNATG